MLSHVNVDVKVTSVSVRVGHGLDPSMDWIGLGQDFEETLWIGLGPMTATLVCQYVRVRRSYDLNVAIFWAILMLETA